MKRLRKKRRNLRRLEGLFEIKDAIVGRLTSFQLELVFCK